MYFDFFVFRLFVFASSYDEGEAELPLKFEDIVDVYYDKMRPPKNKGFNLLTSKIWIMKEEKLRKHW